MQNGKKIIRKPRCNHQTRGRAIRSPGGEPARCHHPSDQAPITLDQSTEGWHEGQEPQDHGTHRLRARAQAPTPLARQRSKAASSAREGLTASTGAEAPGKEQPRLCHHSSTRPCAQVSPRNKAWVCPTLRGCRAMPTHLPTVLLGPPVSPKPNGFSPVVLSPGQRRLRSSRQSRGAAGPGCQRDSRPRAALPGAAPWNSQPAPEA